MRFDPAQQLADAWWQARHGSLLVVSGAGISLASGIATFRGSDPGALWKRDLTELGTYRYFQADPVGSWSWYLSRFDQVLGAKPNAAHQALADLERWQVGAGGRFLLVTQNIDMQHEAAGSRQLVKVHGSADRVRCSRYGCQHGAPKGSLPRRDLDLSAFRNQPSAERLPRCPQCGALLRQHVLWFDEYYAEHQDYQFDRVEREAAQADLVVCVGTSFSVGVTALILQLAGSRGIRVLSVDPAESTPWTGGGIELLRAKAEEILPEAFEKITRLAAFPPRGVQ
jgi:NAD-dependent deacetylase